MKFKKGDKVIIKWADESGWNGEGVVKKVCHSGDYSVYSKNYKSTGYFAEGFLTSMGPQTLKDLLK